MVRLTDRLDMTIVIDWVVKPQNKQNNFVNSFNVKMITNGIKVYGGPPVYENC